MIIFSNCKITLFYSFSAKTYHTFFNIKKHATPPLHATSSAPISDTPLTPLHTTGIQKKSNSMKINQLHNQ